MDSFRRDFFSVLLEEQAQTNELIKKLTTTKFQSVRAEARDHAFRAIEQLSDLVKLLSTDYFDFERRVVRSKVIEEAVDAFKFLLNILNCFEISSREIVEMLEIKTVASIYRAKQKERLEKLRNNFDQIDRIFLIDIDGVLFPAEEEFKAFVKSRGFDQSSLSSSERDRLKEEYRGSARKKLAQPKDGSVEFLKKLQSEHFYNILISSRDSKFPKNFYNTVLWCEKHFARFYDLLILSRSLQYYVEASKSKVSYLDDIRFGDESLLEALKKKRVFAIDDEPTCAKEFASEGFETFLLGKVSSDSQLVSVKDFEAVISRVSSKVRRG